MEVLLFQERINPFSFHSFSISFISFLCFFSIVFLILSSPPLQNFQNLNLPFLFVSFYFDSFVSSFHVYILTTLIPLFSFSLGAEGLSPTFHLLFIPFFLPLSSHFLLQLILDHVSRPNKPFPLELRE